MEGLCNVVTTSTPAGLLHVLHRRRSWLSGWAWPPRSSGDMSLEDCRPFIFKDDDVKADNCFMSELLRWGSLACAALSHAPCAKVAPLVAMPPWSLVACTWHAAFLLRVQGLAFALPGRCASLISLLAGDIFLEKAVEHSLKRTCNQIGSMGNTKVADWVEGSIHQQFYKIRDVVRVAGGEIHGCIFRGAGHRYIPCDPDKPELVGGSLPCAGANSFSCMLTLGFTPALLLRCNCLSTSCTWHRWANLD